MLNAHTHLGKNPGYVSEWISSTKACSQLSLSLSRAKHLNPFAHRSDKDILTLRNVERWRRRMRWWEGRGVGGPWPAWPSGGIRFDWIGVGDLCIKLRLPCDPAFSLGNPTQQWEAELAEGVRWPAALSPDSTGFCLHWVLGSRDVFTFV